MRYTERKKEEHFICESGIIRPSSCQTGYSTLGCRQVRQLSKTENGHLSPSCLLLSAKCITSSRKKKKKKKKAPFASWLFFWGHMMEERRHFLPPPPPPPASPSPPVPLPFLFYFLSLIFCYTRGHRLIFLYASFCFGTWESPLSGIRLYWVIQAGLLTPLTFAQHRLSPLAAFPSGAYFLHNGRRWQWICEFYTANFKGIFGGP